MSYVSTHNHTHYSNLRLPDAIIKPTDLIDRAYELGLSGVAITDHEVLSAHVEAIKHFNKNYKDKDFKLILGNEPYLVEKRDMGIKYPHFLILAKNKLGHKALRELSSIAWKNSYFDRGMERVPITKEELHNVCSKYPNTLIATTACIGGELPQYILKLHKAEAVGEEDEVLFWKQKIASFIGYLISCFGEDNLYLEIAPNTAEEQRIVNRRMKSISKYFNIPLIFATDSHYLKKEDRAVHKAFLNSKDGEREVDDFYSTAYMMTEEEVWEYLSLDFSEEEFKELVQNTKSILDKVESYDLYAPQEIPKISLDKISIRKEIHLSEYSKYLFIMKMLMSDELQDNYWITSCLNKLYEKNLFNEVYLERLNLEAEELWAISEQIGTCMTAYYNTMAKIIDLVWKEGNSLVGVARGSVTGFLSAYLLEITQLDPIQWSLPHWRHISKERPEIPDIDFDSQGLRRAQILQAIKKFFGENNVLNIATFGTEGSKSAILTACRGLGIDSDIGLYLTGMIPQERGFVWPLKDCLYGNPEKDRKPIYSLKQEIDNHEHLEETILKIEGLVNKRSIHAAGIYIFNNGYIENNALMKAPNGQFITQWDMQNSDYMGCLKYDALTIEALDKIRTALDLLIEDNLIEWQGSLKETYNKYLHPDVLDYSEEIWKASSTGEVINLFQFDTITGGQAIHKVKPNSLVEAASANSLMRLMPLEDGTVPVDKFVAFKNDIGLWYKEMEKAGLSKEEQALLEPHYLPVFGVPNTQEDLMEILINPSLVGFTLTEANYARKLIGKKLMSEIPKLKSMIYSRSPLGKHFIDYLYNTAIEPQLGYSFSRNHTTPYTTIALQELNIYSKFPSIYWNTACLSVNAGAGEDASSDYAKIAIALGQIKSRGVKVSLPDINLSKFNFSPDLENNRVLCGLKSLTGVGDDVVNLIIKNRPYKNVEDFVLKVKPTKSAMFSLIKGGCFDSIEKEKTRVEIMKDFIVSITPKKKRISLQTVPSIIESGKFKDVSEISSELSLFEFNRYLKTLKKNGYYLLDDRAREYYSSRYDEKHLSISSNVEAIECRIWDRLYERDIEKLRAWLSTNREKIIDALANVEFMEEWNKYASGNIASWEMDSVSFYDSYHELDKIDNKYYGVSSFDSLPEDPEVDKTIFKYNKKIVYFKTYSIVGTILGKDKTKSTLSILTPSGVVYVKFRPEQFAHYDKQLSEKNSDGVKKILEKSWFSKGRKLLLTGYRRGSEFVLKTYAHTKVENLYLIEDISSDGKLKLRRER